MPAYQWVAYGTALLAVLLLGRGIVVAARVVRLVRTGTRVTGVIVAFREATEKTVVADSSNPSGMGTGSETVYYPKVEFKTGDGTRLGFESRFRLRRQPPDRRVEVLYDPRAPEGTAQIVGWSNQWDPVLRAVAQVVLALAATWVARRWPALSPFH
jgi:uncharacterized protein DUF3592